MRMRQAGLACAALAVAALAGAWQAAPALAQAGAASGTAGDVVAERKAGLKQMAGHLEAIKGILDSRGALEPVAGRATEMQRFFEGFPARFPPGSDTGDTRALPAVWSDRAGFERASANMVAALGKLRDAAAAGDAGATATAFREAGGTCGACHRNYRAR
ncbi:c-type cytochrome [Teichococcus aestuarii]|uniref:c-type cytochrome n=1 Tax=Teichococcus aestuarii TaxID=568898 RepID=UPI0036235782